MRARQPDLSGFVERDGVRVHYESYGAGERTIVFAPADVIVTSEMWKAQVPYLSRYHRVVVIDPRGNGRSDRPTEAEAYTDGEFVADLIAVMDELDIDRAVLGGLCQSAFYALAAAARHPDRVEGVFVFAVWAVEGTPRVDRGTDVYDDVRTSFEAPYTGQDGWHLLNRELWMTDWPRWPRFFFDQITNDPHSSKLYEDLVGWALQSSGDVQAAAALTPYSAETPETVAALFDRVRCPVLVLHGTHDFCQPFARGAHVARMVGGELLALGGSGHIPSARDPIPVNHSLHDFVERVGSGAARQEHAGPARVRIHLSTRRDLPASLPQGRRVPGGTAYGEGPATVVVLPAPDSSVAEAWAGQLPAVAAQERVLVLDDGSDAAAVRAAVSANGPAPVVLIVPPGGASLAAELAHEIDLFSALLVVEAAEQVSAQPGLLDFFFQRLEAVTSPAAVLHAMVDLPTAAAAGRVPTVVVVDGPGGTDVVDADAVAAVRGGIALVDAVDPGPAPKRRRRERRVLYLSSPIGLGHARRDLAIVQALRRQDPDVRVDWLTQAPVTAFLEGAGEHVHPASAWLANESGHIESEAGEHDLHAFQAIRRMDEILVNNFHVFDDLVREREYDAWVGDEAWDLDHFLHENPTLKRAPFVWMTDFVGWVPMPDGGDDEARLTSDYNAEMVEHVARYPHLRDRSVFVGDPDDVIPGALGPGLPDIRAWTEEHFEFSGYVMGERPAVGDRADLRRSLGYAPDETVCVVSVGGSAVGEPLVRRVIDAYDACRAAVPSLRMHVVTGPRLDPGSFAAPEGVTVHGFVPDLDRHHAACDVAIVQGGLSTTMELTAAGRPFLYFPLRHHFEQQVHVRHRLDRHGAGRAMDYETAGPDAIAEALVAELGREVDYLPVPDGGAERAAALVGEVL